MQQSQQHNQEIINKIFIFSNNIKNGLLWTQLMKKKTW